MTSIGTTPNPYAQYGSAYARAAATPLHTWALVAQPAVA